MPQTLSWQLAIVALPTANCFFPTANL